MRNHPLQTRAVSDAQDMLRGGAVALGTRNTLASAERATGQLERQLADLKAGEAGGK